jgi:nucleotide-binding universal stress UspA family protein
VAWIGEHGWEAVVDAVAGLHATDVTLLHVIPEDVVEAPAGMLGRHRRPAVEDRLATLSREAATELLASAADRLGTPGARELRTGRPEREVLDVAAHADLLVLARDSLHPGPRSLGHAARFVVDHATCAVLLVPPR